MVTNRDQGRSTSVNLSLDQFAVRPDQFTFHDIIGEVIGPFLKLPFFTSLFVGTKLFWMKLSGHEMLLPERLDVFETEERFGEMYGLG